MASVYADNVWAAMLLTTLAGLSTAVGGLVVICFGKPSFAKLGEAFSCARGLLLTACFLSAGHMLSFSSGVML